MCVLGLKYSCLHRTIIDSDARCSTLVTNLSFHVHLSIFSRDTMKRFNVLLIRNPCKVVFLLFSVYYLIPHCGMAGVRKVSSSISCFTCHSRNWTDTNCHDPFNPAMSTYSENCKVPKQNHIGAFPARFCVKVIGKKVSTGEELVIRACSLESMDNQCGNFKFEDSIYKGCILTCDYDGCNSARIIHSSFSLLLLCMIIVFPQSRLILN